MPTNPPPSPQTQTFHTHNHHYDEHPNSFRLKVAPLSVEPQPSLFVHQRIPVTVHQVNKVYCISNCHLAYSWGFAVPHHSPCLRYTLLKICCSHSPNKKPGAHFTFTTAPIKRKRKAGTRSSRKRLGRSFASEARAASVIGDVYEL